MLGYPRITLGLPQLFSSQNLLSLIVYKIYNILQKWKNVHEEGPAWLFRNFFHAEASKGILSNSEGSKNRIFISNFAVWFLMDSILAALRRNWSFNNCTLTAEWSTSFLRFCSSKALMCCILLSSSWYLFCKISTNRLWSEKTSILCSTSTWHRL